MTEDGNHSIKKQRGERHVYEDDEGVRMTEDGNRSIKKQRGERHVYEDDEGVRMMEDGNRPIKKQRGERHVNEEDDDGFDRISELPDPILSDILSLLPTEDVAGITLLSKRLNSLWTCSLSVLDLDFESFATRYGKYSSPPNHDDLKNRFNDFVESCMKRELNATCLILTCCEFGLRFAPHIRYRGFCSLKTLIMSRVDLRGEDSSPVTDLINRCPILEELQLEQCVLPSNFELHAPTTSKLESFVMDLCSSSGPSGGSDDEMTDIISSIEIVVPSLLKFKFQGLMPEHFRVSAKNLIEADICFQDRMYAKEHIVMMYKLITDLSYVPTVKLCHSALTTKRNLSNFYQVLRRYYNQSNV